MPNENVTQIQHFHNQTIDVIAELLAYYATLKKLSEFSAQSIAQQLQTTTKKPELASYDKLSLSGVELLSKKPIDDLVEFRDNLIASNSLRLLTIINKLGFFDKDKQLTSAGVTKLSMKYGFLALCGEHPRLSETEEVIGIINEIRDAFFLEKVNISSVKKEIDERAKKLEKPEEKAKIHAWNMSIWKQVGVSIAAQVSPDCFHNFNI